MFVTRADCRGKGVGSRLLQHAVQRHPNHNTVLISVTSAEAFYVKQGFKRMELKLFREYDTEPIIAPFEDIEAESNGVELVRFNRNDDLLKLVVEYDFSIHGQDREALLNLFAENDSCYCLCAKYSLSDKVVGSIVLKKTAVKYKVVAFCADSSEIASALLRKSFEFYSEPNLGFCVAFPSPNYVNSRDVYEKLLQKETKELSSPDTFFSTSGSMDDHVKWEKIYSISELGYMSFA